MSERKATKTIGVRFREHETRKYGKQKDKYFYIRYKKNKRTMKKD